MGSNIYPWCGKLLDMATSIETVYTCDLCGAENSPEAFRRFDLGHVRVDVGPECQAEPISKIVTTAAAFEQGPPAVPPAEPVQAAIVT